MSSTNFFGGNQGVVRKNPLEKNPYEQFDSRPSNPVSSFGKNIASEINKTFGTGLVDSFFNQGNSENTNSENNFRSPDIQRRTPSIRREFNVFRRVEHFESKERPHEIEYLHKQIVQEIKEIKAANAALLSEVNDIDNITVENMKNREGIYYIRFLEVIISILKTLRMKINESRTWLGAANGRAKKRGAAFGARTKKHGTSFSLSQELSTARSVQ
jgi:hypothetical protein